MWVDELCGVLAGLAYVAHFLRGFIHAADAVEFALARVVRLQVAFGRGEEDRRAALTLRRPCGHFVNHLDVAALSRLELDLQNCFTGPAGFGALLGELVSFFREFVGKAAAAILRSVSMKGRGAMGVS